jgi:hypothetical protein
MPISAKRRRSLSRRLRIAMVSVLSFLVTTACSWLRLRSTPDPSVTCYTAVAPTKPPTPVVLCYEIAAPTETSTPDMFTSPISPLPTPTPTSTPEAHRLLLDRLLAEGRFPQDLTRQLES